MKHLVFKPIIAAALLSIGITSCTKEVGSTTVSYSFDLNKSLTSKGGSGKTMSSPNSLVFNGGYLMVSDVEFEGIHADKGEVEIESDQPQKIDLSANAANAVISASIPAGSYTEVEIEIEIEDVLNGPSIVIEGIWYNASGTAVPLRFEFDSEESFEIEMENYTFKADANSQIDININPQNWFSTFTADQLNNAALVNGVLLINDSNNSSLYEVIETMIDNAADAEIENEDND